MWLIPLTITAALLPALFVLIAYSLSLARPSDDAEIRARRRWRMITRGNALWMLGIVAGLIGIGTVSVAGLSDAARAAASVLLVVVTFCPYVVTLGIVDRRIRGADYPLGGYLRFQFTLLLCRWASFLIVIVVLYALPPSVGGDPWPGIGLMIAGAALFVAATLFQMRLIGRATGLLTPVGPDEEPARSIGGLAARAHLSGVRVWVMETFGYPFYNAFAAPGKTVYITRPILGALSADELSAIAAHEIGHLTTLKQRTAQMLILLTAAVVGLWFLVPRIGMILSDIGSFIVEIGAVLVVALLAIFALGAVSRRFETRADATATALMGGNEAVIGALEKIYALNMLPRRFDKKGSENASHPSLERRIAELKGEKLPGPKRRRGVLIVIAVLVLILACLKLLSYLEERSTAPAYPSYGRVIELLEERIAADPGDFEALKRLAVEYYTVEEDRRALEMIDRGLAVRKDPGLMMLRGLILDWGGDPAGALAAMERAYREGGGPQALRWAASLALDLRDTEKARGYLSALKAIDPQDPYAYSLERYLSGEGEQYPFPDYYIVFQGTGR